MASTYDPKCYDLADTFLQDTPELHLHRNCMKLAYEIQRTIEDWIAEEKKNYEPPSPPGFEGGFAANH